MPNLEPVNPKQAVRILLEDTDPVRRSRAHFSLGHRALALEDMKSARDHFEEALVLDPTDERPRVVLQRLPSDAPPSRQRWGRVLGFLRRR